jgi:ferritin-like protein
MTTYEETSKVSEKTLDLKRAIDSLREEMEAVDLYQQRADATKDEKLKKILEHNRDEEKEHAAMLIEWIRRNDPTFSKELKDYLFTDKEIGKHD